MFQKAQNKLESVWHKRVIKANVSKKYVERRNFVQAHNIYGRSFDTVSGTDL